MERMLDAIGHVCASERERAHRRRYEVAALLDADDPNRLRRFEQGNNMPRDLDEVVRAYSEACGIPERELWKRAINLRYGEEEGEEIVPRPERLESIIENALRSEIATLRAEIADLKRQLLLLLQDGRVPDLD